MTDQPDDTSSPSNADLDAMLKRLDRIARIALAYLPNATVPSRSSSKADGSSRTHSTTGATSTTLDGSPTHGCAPTTPTPTSTSCLCAYPHSRSPAAQTHDRQSDRPLQAAIATCRVASDMRVTSDAQSVTPLGPRFLEGAPRTPATAPGKTPSVRCLGERPRFTPAQARYAVNKVY